MRFSTGVSTLALCLATPAFAQDRSPAPAPDTGEPQTDLPQDDPEGTIVVRAPRLRGQLDVDQPPILELSSEDIAAMGAGSIEDVLQQIAPATSSPGGRGSGRPVFLVNGVRIGSFRELRSYPPEAIEKVEVFPAEVAQRFGYSADQRVVNLILRENYSSREVELEYEQPDRGGYSRNEQEFTLLKIAGRGRFNVNLKAEDTSLLTESERGLTLENGGQTAVAGDPDPLDYRSLVADSRSFQGEVNYSKALGDSGVSMSANLTGGLSERRSLSGLDSVVLTDGAGNTAFRTFNAGDPLENNTRTTTLQTSGSLSASLGIFQLVATADAGMTDTRVLIDKRADTSGIVADAAAGRLGLTDPIPALPDAGRDRADTRRWSASSLVTLSGAPLELPAGEVNTTFDLGYDWNRVESEDTRTTVPNVQTRGDLSGGVNVRIPVASRRTGAWEAIGDLSLNAQAGVNHRSDFGTLHDWSLGVTWSPLERVTLTATRIWREAAPGLGTLGDPRVETLNVPIFDFASGDTVLATVITGGNPSLVAETQADWKFSLDYELPFLERGRFRIDYSVNRSDDVTLAAPAFTSAFEQAFPDRMTRDPSGTLLSIDRRPVTLFQTRSRQLSFGLFANGSIGARPEPSRRGGDRGGPPSGEQSDGAGQAGQGRPGGGAGRGGFDPARMAEMREKLCSTPEGEIPDLTGVPEPILARLRGEDGKIDPEKLAQARKRFCGEEAEERSERFAALRTAICADPPKLDGLPEAMLARLRNEDGEVDPERLKQMRERMCSADGEAPKDAEQRQGGQVRGGGRRGGGPGAMFGRGDDPRPRYFLSLNHNLVLENEVQLAPGSPPIDQLAGNAISGGAIAEHTTQLRAGLFFQGYGLRLSGNYTGDAVLRGNGLPTSSDLFFGDFATFDLRLFADLGQITNAESGLFKDFRVSVRVDNVFDARRRVTDANGDVPDAYAPFRADPTGRYIGIDLRKLF